MSDLKYLDDEEEDNLLARIKEESLRHYNEVELPRRSQITQTDAGCSKNVENPMEESLSMEPLFYNGKEAQGFYLFAGNTYIYPSNYPVRKYQADIVPSALFNNTLVCLPTGLGKTFIAAVVMYNYYRWYPTGKIVFMAPTKPLVAQQIKACRNIMGIPEDDTIEMTGTTSPSDRQQQWCKKRVFYLTPQVMINDIKNKLFNPDSVKCLVIDEAHRATKGYAYCQVVNALHEEGVIFRLLALSATPGSDVKSIKSVIETLRISKLEVRTEDSPDVIPYTHSRLVDSITVELPQYVRDIWNKYIEVYENYLKRIRDTKVMTANISTMSKFQVLMACRKFTSNPPSTLPKHLIQLIIADFNACVSLAHARELLEIYGLRTFYNYFIDAEKSKERSSGLSRLCHDPDLRNVLETVDKMISEVNTPPDKYIWSHPKMEEIVKVVKKHFVDNLIDNEQTKIIVFCQFRLVVSEVHDILEKFVPQAKPVMFVGQSGKEKGDGLPQKKQLEVMKMFRAGEYNILIATCVAEEGLDIGDVDLLILTEAHRSPVRLVQRMGRTGRHRNGRCVVLLTKGSEVKKFQDGMYTHKNYSDVLNSQKVLNALCEETAPMIPPGYKPKKQLLHIKVMEKSTPGKKKKQCDIRQAFGQQKTSTVTNSSSIPSSAFLNEEELAEVRNELGTYFPNFNRLPTSSEVWPKRHDNVSVQELLKYSSSKIFLSRSDRCLGKTFVIGHSEDTEMLVDCLQKAEEIKKRGLLGKPEKPRSLWSTIAARGMDEDNEALFLERIPKKKSRHKSDIREHLINSTERLRRLKEESLLGEGWFKTQSNAISNEYISPCDINEDKNATFYEDNEINNNCDEILNEIIKEYENEFNYFCKKVSFKYFSNFGNLLTNSCNELNNCMNEFCIENFMDLIENITEDDIKRFDVTSLFKMNKNELHESPEDFNVDCFNGSTDSNFFESPVETEDFFVGIDDILKDMENGLLIEKQNLSEEKQVIRNKSPTLSGFNKHTLKDFTQLKPIKCKSLVLEDKENAAQKKSQQSTDVELWNNTPEFLKDFDDLEFNILPPSCVELKGTKNKAYEEKEKRVQMDKSPILTGSNLKNSKEIKPVVGTKKNKCENNTKLTQRTVNDMWNKKVPKEVDELEMEILSCNIKDKAVQQSRNGKAGSKFLHETPEGVKTTTEMDKRSKYLSTVSYKTPERKTQIETKADEWQETPECFKNIELKLSPILTGTVVRNKKTKPDSIVSQTLSGRFQSTLSQFSCSTPKHKKPEGNKYPKLDVSHEKCLSEDGKNQTKLMNASINQDSDNEVCDEEWNLDDIIATIEASKYDLQSSKSHKKLSYFLDSQQDKSMYSVSRLVEKAIEMDKNDSTDNKDYVKTKELELNEDEIVWGSDEDIFAEYSPKIQSTINEVKEKEDKMKEIVSNISRKMTEKQIQLKETNEGSTQPKKEPISVKICTEKKPYNEENYLFDIEFFEESFNIEKSPRNVSSNVKKPTSPQQTSPSHDALSDLFTFNKVQNIPTSSERKNSILRLRKNGFSKCKELESDTKLEIARKPKLNYSSSETSFEENGMRQATKLEDSFKSVNNIKTKINFKQNIIRSDSSEDLGIIPVDVNKSRNASSLQNISTNTSKSDSIIKVKPRFLNSSDTDSEVFLTPKKNRTRKPEKIIGLKQDKKKKHKTNENKFIHSQAEVSGEETSSGSDVSGEDSANSSFINDESLTQRPETSMHANYLHSIRNAKPTGFKIPQLTDSVMDRDVYSQYVMPDCDSYMNDSFCVDSSEQDENSPDDDDMSLLEQAERLLEKKRKKRSKKTKKRRISVSSSSSETDFEVSKHHNSTIERRVHKKKRRIVSSESD